MIILSVLYARSYMLPPVAAILTGLQVIVVAIVANATVSFGRTSLKRVGDVVVAVIAAGLFGLRVSPILVIVLGALLGCLVCKEDRVEDLAPAARTDSRFERHFVMIAAIAALGVVLLLMWDPMLFDLAIVMLKVDLFAFGGGFASVPLMYHETVEVRSWIDSQTFLNGIALGQITPGPIVITATFVGYMVSGVLGAVVATLSIFLPSFLLVIGTARYFDRLRSMTFVKKALNGILACFIGLLLVVTFRFASDIPWDGRRAMLGAVAFVALLSKVELIWVVLGGTAFSAVFFR
jgi:chromate transporter